MKKIISVFLTLFTSIIIVFGQDIKYSNKEIQQKLDSIKTEGNLLYSYENASWNATDLARANSKIAKQVGGYLSYKSSDTVKTAILNSELNLVIAEYSLNLFKLIYKRVSRKLAI